MSSNGIITDADRELLAQAYEETWDGGPFPYYAEEARDNPRAFARASLRAIARARLSTAGTHLVDDFLRRLKGVSRLMVFVLEADAIHQFWIEGLPEPDRDRVRAAISARIKGEPK